MVSVVDTIQRFVYGFRRWLFYGFRRGRKHVFYGFRRWIFGGFCRRRRIQNFRTSRAMPCFCVFRTGFCRWLFNGFRYVLLWFPLRFLWFPSLDF